MNSAKLVGGLVLCGAVVAAPEAAGQCEGTEFLGGVLSGRVTDDDRGEGIGGASILVSWEGGSSSGESDERGRYEVCGIRVGVPLSVIAGTGSVFARPLEFILPAGGRFELDLEIPTSDDRAVAVPGMGDIVGIVVASETGRPIAGATIRVVEGPEEISRGDGRFRLRGVRSGLRRVEVEHLVYGRTEIDLDVEDGIVSLVELSLDPRPVAVQPIRVVVEGRRNLRLDRHGFYDRRSWAERLGHGHFLTAEDVVRRRPQRLSHLIADFPGTDVTCPGAAIRGCRVRMVRAPTCDQADVYLNGTRVIAGDGSVTADSRPTLDELVAPWEVAGLEVYTGAATTPAEFSGSGGQCGAIVIWTK